MTHKSRFYNHAINKDVFLLKCLFLFRILHSWATYQNMAIQVSFRGLVSSWLLEYPVWHHLIKSNFLHREILHVLYWKQIIPVVFIERTLTYWIEPYLIKIVNPSRWKFQPVDTQSVLLKARTFIIRDFFMFIFGWMRHFMTPRMTKCAI